MMLDYYKDFKDSFYHLANDNPSVLGIYSIGEVTFFQFLDQQKYVSKRVTLPKIMLKMYSCLSSIEDDTSPEKKSLDMMGDTSKKKSPN